MNKMDMIKKFAAEAGTAKSTMEVPEALEATGKGCECDCEACKDCAHGDSEEPYEVEESTVEE